MSDLLNKASLVMVPSGYKEDTVYSVIPTDGSGDLAFTRASNGTRVNSAGLVEVCPWNMLTYSEDLSNGAWSLQGSSVTTDSTTAPNGTTTADTLIESNTNNEHNRFQNINISGQHTFSVYLKKYNVDWCALYVFNPSVGGVRYWINVNTLTAGTSANIGAGIGTTSLTLESVGNGWVRASILFNNPSGDCRFYVANAQSDGGATTYAGNGTSGVYVWGAQVNLGTLKPYFPTTDRLNVPRLTYQNGGGGCPSLLLEKQSTNVLTYSEDFSNAAWIVGAAGGGSNPVITANNAISPDGTQNADKIVFVAPASGDISQIQQITTLTGTATGSIYIKAVSSDDVGKIIAIRFNSGTYALITLTADWQRFSTTQTSLLSFDIALRPALGTSTGTVSAYIWGAQLEASSYATSYIPTTSSSATRVADYVSRSGLALTNSTFAVNFKPLDYVVELFDFEKTGGGRMFYIAVQSNGYITFNSVSGGTIGAIGSIIPKNQTCKLAFTLNASTSNLTVFINGSKIGTYATNITTFGAFFGLQSFGYNPGTQIEQIAIFPSVLTDAECQSLTTL